MLDIYLCEDEEIQLLRFAEILDKYIESNSKNAKIISKRWNPEETLKDAKKNAENENDTLFFIDVQLGDTYMNGFDLAQRLKELCPKCYLVFLTSKEELAYQAFERELDVLDYIVKRPEYFLEEVNENLKQRFDRIFAKIGKDLEKRKSRTTKIKIESGSKMIEIDLNEIIFVQSIKQNHQLEIITRRQRVETRQTLKKMQEILGEGFIYVNKSCLVAKNKIQEIDRENRFVKLEGGYRLEISHRELKNVVSIMK